jgi:DNA (cytosine-5)-methyltransferase 1
MKTEVIDLFCGIGGLSQGFRDEGFAVLAGIDADETCKHAFEKNIGTPFIAKSVTDVTAAELGKIYSGRAPKVLVGCAPCQPFSMYTGRYRRDETDIDASRRWVLLDEFARLIETASPDVVSMENVLRLTVHPAFEKFTARLRTAGYEVSHQRVRAQDYGVPQRRARLVLFASKFGKVHMVPPTHAGRPVTVRDAIGHLPRLVAGAVDGEDRLHMARSLSALNLRRIRATREGGSWREWDDSLQLECHKRDGGKSFRAVYGRMVWDEPSPVITTQCLGIGNGRFGHPVQDRAISLREAAMLQSFPPNFDFAPAEAKIYGSHLARQIGNAVPPRLGQAVARSIRLHIEAAQPIASGNRSRRCRSHAPSNTNAGLCAGITNVGNHPSGESGEPT